MSLSIGTPCSPWQLAHSMALSSIVSAAEGEARDSASRSGGQEREVERSMGVNLRGGRAGSTE